MKLGPHIIYPTTSAVAWAMVAPIAKVCDFDSAGANRLIRQLPQDRIAIWRHWPGSQPAPAAIWNDGEAYARVVIASIGGFRRPGLYLETLNEEKQNLGEGLEQSVLFHRQFSHVAHEEGYLVAGFGCSTGNPKGYPGNPEKLPDSITYLLNEGWGDVDALGLGEYWGGGGMPGTGWNCMRCVLLDKWTNGDHPAIYIRECGRDAIGNPLGDYAATPGWKTQGISAEAFMDEWTRLNALWEPHDWLLGGCAYAAGTDQKWDAFSVDHLPMKDHFSGLPPRTSWRPTSIAPSPTLEDTVGQTLEQFITEHPELGQTWVKPKAIAKAIKRAAVTDHHLLVEYADEKGETWVTPLKQDDSFFG